MTHGSLFSGIGGFDLAAEWMGWENIFHCEIGEFPRKILKHHFPNSICYEDIKKTDFTKHRGEIDIISGGFPCQPYSNAGKRRGKEDDRHLWPEMLRVIREVQPRFVVGENVAGLLSWNNGMVFHEIITDLENEGYETQAFLIPACATNAPHRRDRIWFVAHSIYCGYSTKRGKETEKDGIQSKIGKTMDSREFDGTSVSRITAHSSSNGCNERGEKVNGREINKFQNRNKIWDKITSNGKQSNAPDTDGSRINRKEKHEDNNKNSRDWKQSNNTNNNGEVWRTTPHTKSQRTREQSSEDRGWKDRRFDNDGEEGNVADTMHERLQRQRRTIRELEGQIGFISTNTRVIKGRTWENFPTQSPICGGDDGISTELDGITFPKWRNESIKGYGNAVVPQVVYQIFKAIEQSLL